MSLRLHPLRRFAQSGFTIVELMVSVVIALILMIALMQLLLRSVCMVPSKPTAAAPIFQECKRAVETL